MYQHYNPNPNGSYTGDCVIRAISKAMNTSWDNAYIDLVLEGYVLKDMPSANKVWASYLMRNGFDRVQIDCPKCFTFAQFVSDHPDGTYILATGTHVATAIEGVLYDAWDSSAQPVLYAFQRRS